jgi:hypothetical protein
MSAEMSSLNVANLFTGMEAGARAMQDGYQATSAVLSQPSAMEQPRRQDGYFQSPAPQYSGVPYGGQQPYQAPPTYGYGYAEAGYANNSVPGQFTNPFMPQTASNNMNNPSGNYWGFFNPAYGK